MKFVKIMSTFKATTVIGLYKRLHRTSQRVFNGDDSAIRVASNKIRSEYEKNRRVANGPAVAELIQLGTVNQDPFISLL